MGRAASVVYQTNSTFVPPPGVTRVKVIADPKIFQPPFSIVTGNSNIFFRDNKNQFYAWGFNPSGVTAVGAAGTAAQQFSAATNQSTPTVVLGGNMWKSYGINSASSPISGFLDVNGNLWTCGANNNGQLGANLLPSSVVAVSSPVLVAGQNSWQMIASAFQSQVGLDTQGRLWSWGLNFTTQLGQANSATGFACSSPIQVAGGGTYVGVHGTNSNFASAYLAIDVNGNIWSWGSNASGILGQNVTPTAVPQRSSPVMIAVSNVKFVKVNSTYDSNISLGTGIALDSQGRIWTWGNNLSGELGQSLATTTVSSSPALIAGAGSQVFVDFMPMQTVGGSAYVIALDSTGKMWGWGNSSDWELNVLGARSSPIVIGGGKTFVSLAMPKNAWNTFGVNPLGIDANGALWTWGSNIVGIGGTNQLPTTTPTISTPTLVAGLPPIAYAGAQGTPSYAVDTSGRVWVWGQNTAGALGNNGNLNMSSPVLITGTNLGNNSGLAVPLPQPESIMEFDVTPGVSYGIVVIGGASIFNGVVVAPGQNNLRVVFDQ